jgi:hypothetical protein
MNGPPGIGAGGPDLFPQISLSANKINVLPPTNAFQEITPSQATVAFAFSPSYWKIAGPCSDSGTRFGGLN